MSCRPCCYTRSELLNQRRNAPKYEIFTPNFTKINQFPFSLYRRTPSAVNSSLPLPSPKFLTQEVANLVSVLLLYLYIYLSSARSARRDYQMESGCPSDRKNLTVLRYDTIVYLTCSKKLTVSQLSLPHGINKKLKCKTKNKMMSVIGPVQSRYREAVQ